MEMEDKIINKLVEMDAKLDQMSTKSELLILREEMNLHFDQQEQILQRLDQERLFTLERIKRIEADVEQMKTILQIA